MASYGTPFSYKYDMRRFIDIVEQVHQAIDGVDTDLRDWFGNGIITDEDGDPLLVHHFTYNDFDKFDRLWAATTFNRDPEGIDTLGVWFTMNPAMRYVSDDPGFGHGQRMDCYLRVKKAKFYDDEEPYAAHTSAWMQLFNDTKEAGGSSAMRERLSASGYDCVILLDTFLDGQKQTVIIVLNEDDIRIAERHSTIVPNKAI